MSIQNSDTNLDTHNSDELTVQDAHKLLKQFDCLTNEPDLSASKKTLLRQALLLLSSLSDYQMFGVCADTAEQGYSTLETYLQALNYNVKLNQAVAEGPVYIKFNSKTGLSYLDRYSGRYRGVLVTCQSSQEEVINETYGHFPLDLFMLKS